MINTSTQFSPQEKENIRLAEHSQKALVLAVQRAPSLARSLARFDQTRRHTRHVWRHKHTQISRRKLQTPHRKHLVEYVPKRAPPQRRTQKRKSRRNNKKRVKRKRNKLIGCGQKGGAPSVQYGFPGPIDKGLTDHRLWKGNGITVENNFNCPNNYNHYLK